MSAEKLFRHIFGGQRGIMAIVSAEQVEGGEWVDGTVEHTYFSFPSQLQEAVDHAWAESERGRSAYYCAHLLTKERRVKDNAAQVVSLWGECDGAELPNGDLKPTAAVESSPGKFHVSYRLTEPLTPKTAEALNERLAADIGADPSGFDLSQLLRVPGTINYKYPERPEVKVIGLDGSRAYTPAELDELLSAPSENGRGHTSRDTHGEPPVNLSESALGVWRGKNPKFTAAGKVDRSATLLKIGRVLYDAGANRAVIEDALAERDESLGYRCFSGRRDARERYQGTVDELEREGRNSRLKIGFGERRQSEAETDDSIEDKPQIQINNRHLQDITEDALSALAASNDPAELFVRSGALVRVAEDENGVPSIQEITEDALKGRLARAAYFYRANASKNSPDLTRADPPTAVVKDILALPASVWQFPALEAIVETPILRADGTIHEEPGYDPETRLYYRPAPGFYMDAVPDHPSSDQLNNAVSLIDEAVGEFPYADRASAANTLAYLLSPVVRQAIDGCAPLAVIDKPQAGTGGSLLAEVAGEIGSGRSAEMLGAPRDEEEWRKQITSKLSEGATMITIDNVDGALWAPSLARALTARTWTDRVLGRTGTITVKQRATWAATGNNIMLRGDLPRRCYWIRLDAKQARPWQRQQFKHPALLSWVRANRGRLVHALLTIARSWYTAGCPKDETLPRLGSFESWTATIGGMVSHAGFSEFLGNLEELYEKAAEGEAEWEAFLEAWWRERGEDSITGKDLAKLIEERSALKDALPADLAEALDKGTGAFTRRLGKALAKRVGTRYGEDSLHIVEAGEYRRAKLWSVQDSSGECEFVSFVSSYNPNAENFGKQESHNNTGAGQTNSTNSQTHSAEDEGTRERRRI